MRIGFFSDFYLPRADGVAFSIETFRTQLEARGHEVYVFAPKPGLRYKEPSKHIVRFPAVKGLFFDDYMTSLFFPPQAIKQIEKLDLDIIHYHTPSQIGLLGAYFALRHDIPLVTTYHTDLFEYVKHYPSVLPGTIALSLLAPVITGGGMKEYREGLSSIKPERNIDRWNQKIVERGITMIHNHCDLVITPSHKIEHQLTAWKTIPPVEVLPTGVDKITTNTREIAAMRKRFKLETKDHVVLFVGRMGTEKNVGLLIKSFDAVARKDPKAKLVLVGTGEDLENFQEQANTSPYAERIIFTGFVERHNLGAMYAIARLFVFPSLADTQGMTVNEAACAGLPIVMVDPEITEVVKDGINGYFAKPNPRDLAAKIVRVLLSNEPEQAAMSRESLKLAAACSASHQTTKLLRLYEETIERHREAKSSPFSHTNV